MAGQVRLCGTDLVYCDGKCRVCTHNSWYATATTSVDKKARQKMTEYIEREAAIMTAMDYDGDGNAQDASQDIASALGDIPAADVVPVVRCYDCELWEAYTGHNGDVGFGWCENGVCDTTHALFFCASGRRRRNNDG